MSDQFDQARPQPTMLTPVQAAHEALAHTRAATQETLLAVDRLERMIRDGRTPPEMRTIHINPGNNGRYTTLDQARWEAKSIGVLNVGPTPVFIGIGGVSATANSGAPQCPAQAALTLPVLAQDLEFGCDPAVLAGNTATIYVFRFLTLQPLALNI